MKNGALPQQLIEQLIEDDRIQGISAKYVNPASIDLPLSSEAFRLEKSFLPRPKTLIRTHLKEAGATAYDLKNPLEVGIPYLIRIDGRCRLRNSLYGYANPKSTSGRCGLTTKLVADGVDMYDHVSQGWGQSNQEMWVLVVAGAFPVKVAPGLALSQLRLFDGKSFLDELELDHFIDRDGLIFDRERNKLTTEEVRRHADSIFLSVKVGQNMGWECRGTRKVVDMTAPPGSINSADFFEPIAAKNESYTLRKGTFYILVTSERVMVPPKLSAELREVDPRLFDGPVHAAGFIDSGWGYGKAGEGCGRPITLEVTPTRDTLIQDGQRIGRIRFEWLKEEPRTPYDEGNANYADVDGVKLPKYFKV